MNGYFIVIDGTDGSGKKTQTDLLIQRLEQEGYPTKLVDFPQYGQYSAVFIEKYLNGHFGTVDEVTPEQASLFYALDRYAASKQIRTWLAEGYIIVSNRYTSANMGHQGGKIADPAKRQAFIDWVLHLEFTILNIPQPNITFFLHVPHHIGMELVKEKTIQRDYIEGETKVDIHEADKNHLRMAEESYCYVAATDPTWHRIQCCTEEEGILRTRDAIHSELWEEVLQRIPKQ